MELAPDDAYLGRKAGCEGPRGRVSPRCRCRPRSRVPRCAVSRSSRAAVRGCGCLVGAAGGVRGRGLERAGTVELLARSAAGWVGRPNLLRAGILQTLSAVRGPCYPQTMRVTETAAGTPIIERTPEEQAAYLEREVQREMGMSVAEFTRALCAGELDLGDMDVFYVAGLLRVGQNGQSAAA